MTGEKRAPGEVLGRGEKAEAGTRSAITQANYPSPKELHKLGIRHFLEFQRYGRLDDVKKSIEYTTRAVDETPDDDPELPGRLGHLGISYLARFLHLGDFDDIGQAIAHMSRGLDSAPEGHPDMPTWLNNLGLSYTYRFQHAGILDDLGKAIEFQTQAVNLISDGRSDLPMRLSNLGMSFRERFLRIGKVDDIEQAIAHTLRAVELAPEDHTSLPGMLDNLGSCYSERFDRLGTLVDLAETIKYKTRAVKLTPDGHPDLPSRVNDLGLCYQNRFLRLGKLDDIEQAITYLSRAVESTPEGHTNSPIYLSNLGACHTNRFERLGALDDLDKGIEYETRAIDLTPSTRTVLPTRLSNAGLSYFKRFNHLGTLEDLAKSIDFQIQAIDLTPEDHPNLPMRLSNLALPYQARFLRLGDLDDAEQAIKHLSRAVVLTPEGHPDLPKLVGNLGGCYSERYDRLRTLDDLEQAIKYENQAVDLTPDGHQELPNRLSNLGLSYRSRFLRLGELNDLDNSNTQLSRALASTPDGHPILTRICWNLALIELSLYHQTEDDSHLRLSLNYFRKASQLSTGPPRERFWCALDWAKHGSEHSGLDRMEAYHITMELLPQFIWLGASKSQKYDDLTGVENLAINAAAAAIYGSNHALALEWLEQARCVVWNQSLMLRSPIDPLHSSHPALAVRLQDVAKQLQDATSDTLTFHTSMIGSDDLEQASKLRYSLAKEYDTLLAESRTLPGFEDFLRPMKANSLMGASQNGPVVVINCHKNRCDALIISDGQASIKHLSLPHYNQEKARSARYELQASLNRKGLRQRGFTLRLPSDHKDGFATMLRDLWVHVVKPVLDFLGFTNDVPLERLPHITWCPTGAMTFLPMHAAGDYKQTRAAVYDFVISSYTPTLTALLRPASSQLTHTPRVLAIGQANTPGHAPLPGTAEELESLKGHTQGNAKYSQLAENQATVTAVLDAMEQHDWVHLACHAHQNVDDPTKSGFYLHDGTLDLAAINRRSFKNKGLAFLSACQTATGDEKLPDEAIHLASGMLMAGYQSVIATMWSVMDDDAPFIADMVYADLIKEGKIAHGEAGKALHYAVAALRDKVGITEFARWVPYVHIGS